jgi:dTDP-glucose 4,6-dehydratase
VHPTRDFSYIADTVAGFVAALDCADAVGQTINLGSGYEISIAETARIIAQVMGVQIDLEMDEQRLRPANSEVERLWSSNDKARRLLRWAPEYAGSDGFRKGVLQTVEWFSNAGQLASYKPNAYNI